MQVLVIIALLIFGKAVLAFIVTRLKKIAFRHNEENTGDLKRRADTLGGVIQATGNVVIWAVVIIMALELFGVDIRPILAGVGIVGLAIGFGAQAIVKDFVSGLFILIENQYSVGDKVSIGTVTGEVIQVTIRSTVIRSEEGNIVYLSNGIVATKDVVNLTQKGLHTGYGSKEK